MLLNNQAFVDHEPWLCLLHFHVLPTLFIFELSFPAISKHLSSFYLLSNLTAVFLMTSSSISHSLIFAFGVRRG